MITWKLISLEIILRFVDFYFNGREEFYILLSFSQSIKILSIENFFFHFFLCYKEIYITLNNKIIDCTENENNFPFHRRILLTLADPTFASVFPFLHLFYTVT